MTDSYRFFAEINQIMRGTTVHFSLLSSTYIIGAGAPPHEFYLNEFPTFNGTCLFFLQWDQLEQVERCSFIIWRSRYLLNFRDYERIAYYYETILCWWSKPYGTNSKLYACESKSRPPPNKSKQSNHKEMRRHASFVIYHRSSIDYQSKAKIIGTSSNYDSMIGWEGKGVSKKIQGTRKTTTIPRTVRLFSL